VELARHTEAQHEPEPQAAVAPVAGDPVARLLALQQTIGNRAVGRLIARQPGGAVGVPGIPDPLSGEMAARARIENEIRELEEAVGPLSADDREFIARALAAKHEANTGHSVLDLAKTTVWHPVKVTEHVGPKGLISDRLAEDRYLMERFPNLWPELVRFYSSSGSTPTVNVVTLFDYRFEKAPHEAYNLYKYLQAKRGEGEKPERVAVTPSMFGDTPQGLEEASLLLGSFNVLAERVHLPREPGYEGGSQFKLVVTDSLGLQAGQKGYFKGLSNIVGSKNVILAEYLGAVDGAGNVDVKPWSARYEPKEPPRCDPSGTCELF